ncbi:hypothetical protein GHT06_021702 [Daphnia sinensis]|uniref:Uncharacterized protein n=1 Tax=Daphnia sinensis TaxID=1820382 RepID=A0AAD5PNS9_9CRUS|nr:hypothetical protein GHT06_021702 [Daphnia sinensis]
MCDLGEVGGAPSWERSFGKAHAIRPFTSLMDGVIDTETKEAGREKKIPIAYHSQR